MTKIADFILDSLLLLCAIIFMIVLSPLYLIGGILDLTYHERHKNKEKD